MDLFCDMPEHRKKTAIIDETGRSFTYEELHGLAREFQGALPEKKSFVLIKSANTIESVIGYIGGIAGGHAVLLADQGLDDELFNNILKSYQPEFLWQPLRGDGGSGYRYQNYELIPTDVVDAPPLFPGLSLVLLTSGSTGSPKGVRLTRGNLNANAKSIATYLGLDDTERPVTNLPIHYAYGLSVINSHLFVGATLLLTNTSVIKKEFWDFFKAYQATSLTGVPYTYEMLKTFRFMDMDLPSLRYFTQAGGKLRSELVTEYAEFAQRKGIRFYVMYGQTEATARISYLPPEYALSKNKSIGMAIPDGKLELRDDRGERICTPGEEGILYYEGPNVMLGYASDRAGLGKGDEQKGSLVTGDIACFDEDGFFYIVGRMSRFIKILGKRMNLDEIEHHLRQQGYDCASGGYDDLLLIAVTDMTHLQPIREMMIKKFKIDYENVDVFQVPEIKKNSSGKIRYEEIFSQYKKR